MIVLLRRKNNVFSYSCYVFRYGNTKFRRWVRKFFSLDLGFLVLYYIYNSLEKDVSVDLKVNIVDRVPDFSSANNLYDFLKVFVQQREILSERLFIIDSKNNKTRPFSILKNLIDIFLGNNLVYIYVDYAINPKATKAFQRMNSYYVYYDYLYPAFLTDLSALISRAFASIYYRYNLLRPHDKELAIKLKLSEFLDVDILEEKIFLFASSPSQINLFLKEILDRIKKSDSYEIPRVKQNEERENKSQKIISPLL